MAKLLTYGGQVIDPTAYIYIYIHAVELLSGPSLGFLEVIIWSKFVFFYRKTPIAQNTIKFVVSAHFCGKIECTKFCKLLSGPSWRFFFNAPNLDQIITSNLDQIITSKNVFFL